MDQNTTKAQKEHDRYRREAVAELQDATMRAESLFVNTCRRILESPDIYISFGEKDKLRLLNLEAWSQKFQVSYQLILEFLLSVWAGKYTSKTRAPKQSIGVRIGTLLGRKSRAILEQHIKERYPEGENKRNWRDEKADQILRHVICSSEYYLDQEDSPEDLALNYRKMLALRKKSEAEVAVKLQRRKFRGNPFMRK